MPAPPGSGKGFHQGFLAGRDFFLLETEIKEKKKSLRSLEEEASTLEARIKEREAALSPDCADPASCRQALDQIRTLDRELVTKKRMIRREKQTLLGLSQTLKAQIAAIALTDALFASGGQFPVPGTRGGGPAFH